MTPPNEVYKRMAFDEVIAAMLYRDPSSAARWIDQLDGKPYLAGSAVGKTAAAMAETAPKQALDWLQSLDGLTEKQAAQSLSSTVGIWAQTIEDDKRHQRTEMEIARRMMREEVENAAGTLAEAGFTQDQIAKAQAGARARYEWDLAGMTLGSISGSEDQRVVMFRSPEENGRFQIVTRVEAAPDGSAASSGQTRLRVNPDSLGGDLLTRPGEAGAGGGGEALLFNYTELQQPPSQNSAF